MADSVSVPGFVDTERETADPRHSALVRVTHWITALCFLALLVSGIEIVISHPRFYWGETGNVLTPSLFDLPIPSSRSSVQTGYSFVLSDQNGWSLVTRHSLAREFPRSQISKGPFANGKPPDTLAFKVLQAGSFLDWRLDVDGMVANPSSFSLEKLRSYPSRSQITHLACEEGWSFIAEWAGVPLSHILSVVGALPESRYVVYRSIQSNWWDSVDMADALHPQTLLTYGMNGGELPVAHGGPIRLRVPRQLGYKSVKYITRLIVTDSLKEFGTGLGSAAPEDGYSWYAGI